MHPILVPLRASGTGAVRNILGRVTKGDHRMGHDVFGQLEQSGLIGYSFFHRPGAQLAGADSQTFGGEDHILGGDGSINDPKLPAGCKKLRSGKIAAH